MNNGKSINKFANLLGMSKEKTISLMLKLNKDVDYQNIPENGFKNKKEVDAWWANKSKEDIVKIFDEYYDLTAIFCEKI